MVVVERGKCEDKKKKLINILTRREHYVAACWQAKVWKDTAKQIVNGFVDLNPKGLVRS